ncbi:terminase small subunit [Hyphomicrobium sp. ghe19]|uniref:terminase small subunit n=1 Tax=Hyphomicrobium sp. ghe19 TaxID=2682968 RepID=UPI001367015B|nr:hypothetical protein HYPP_00123 [Hyphomicrobium sp. ghe19]
MISDATKPALTPKQRRFVENYLLDLNATQAAIRAGYSKRTAQEQGSQLLNHPTIRIAIDAAKAERSAKTEICAEQVLEEIAAMAFYDPGELMIEGAANAGDPIEAVIDGRVIYGLRCPADIKRLPENAWMQAEAASRLGITQPRVSDMMRGKIELFSFDALFAMAGKLE